MASPFVEKLRDAIFTGMDYAAMPGDYVRGLLAGEPGERLGGRDLLESWGLLDKNQEGLDVGDVLGFGVGIATDPINLALGGAGSLLRLGKGVVAGARGLSRLARGAKTAETINNARRSLGGLMSGMAKTTPGLAYSIGAPVGGMYMMAHNKEDNDLQNLAGLGLMLSPLMLPMGMAAARRMKPRKWSKKSLAEWNAAEEAKSATNALGVPTQSISRNEIDFLEQLGIRDAVKWKEIKDAVAQAGIPDIRQPASQPYIAPHLPQRTI